MFKKSKGLRTFKTYKAGIASIATISEGNIWINKVKESIKLYIGVGDLYNEFDKYKFSKTIQVPTNVGNFLTGEPITKSKYEFDETKKINFNNLLDGIIHHIENNGVIPSKNFVSDLSSNAIWGIIISVAVGGFTVGGLFLSFKYDIDKTNLHDQNVEYQKQIKELTDKLNTCNAKQITKGH